MGASSGPLVRRLPLDAERAQELAQSLTEGDLEYLIRKTRAGIRRDEKAARRARPVEAGQRDANKYKLERARDLEARLVRALGRDPDVGEGPVRSAHGRAREAVVLDGPVTEDEVAALDAPLDDREEAGL